MRRVSNHEAGSHKGRLRLCGCLKSPIRWQESARYTNRDWTTAA
jgi:hypothetical protein